LASSTTKPFAFYILTQPTDTEAALPDSEAIGFDYGIDESSVIGVVGFSIGEPQRSTDVPNIASGASGERSSSHPDTGIITVKFTIDFIVNEKFQNNPKPIAKLLKWSLRDQTVRGDFPKGRFCLRNDKMNSLPTILATATAGIKMINLSVSDEIEWSDHQTGTIECEYTGDYNTLITNLNTIINA
jgi:hypothetical protein